jgi:hypothetical protein
MDKKVQFIKINNVKWDTYFDKEVNLPTQDIYIEDPIYFSSIESSFPVSFF